MNEITEKLKNTQLTMPYGESALHREGRFTIDLKLRDQLDLAYGTRLEQHLVHMDNEEVGILILPIKAHRGEESEEVAAALT